MEIRGRVLSVASECVPLVKTGGLADVAGALPAAVAPHGIAMTTLLPGFPSVMAAVVIILIVLVQLVQSLGEWLAAKVDKRAPKGRGQ